MPLQLAQEEPEAGPWRVELLSAVIEAVTRPGPGRVTSGRPVIVAVDGRSNNGKTTLAAWIRDEREAGRRALARPADPDPIGTANRAADGPRSADADAEWMAEERPFKTAQRTWERAGIIVCGTPQIPCDPAAEIVVAPPPGRS